MSSAHVKLFLKIHKFWGNFYRELDNWCRENNHSFDEISDEKERSRLQNNAIRQHISSTHSWTPGKFHWHHNNWHIAAIECKACGLLASDYDEVGFERVKISTGEIPSRDTHNHFINRTCEEIKLAKEKRKHRKNQKCIQCGTYGCLFNGY